MSDATPRIDLKLPEAALCSRHGEPFRKAWPTGMAQLTILALETIQTDEELGAERGGDVTKIAAALLARPACERVPIGRLRAMYVDSKIGVAGTCVVCGRERLGTEYQRTEPPGRLVVDPHVCFECVLERMAPA